MNNFVATDVESPVLIPWAEDLDQVPGLCIVIILK